MIPVNPPKKYKANCNLTIPGDPNGDLPARKITNADSGLHECFESFWQLQPGEREALLKGNPILLKIYSDRHPVVVLSVSAESFPGEECQGEQ